MMNKAIFIFIISAAFVFGCKDKTTPHAISDSDAQVELAISGSDDYKKHKSIFINSTKKLVENGSCTLSELKNMGGWMRSQNQKTEPIYFTYCGDMTSQNKIYLNVATGDIYIQVKP